MYYTYIYNTTRRSDTGHVLHIYIYIIILGEVTQVMYYTYIYIYNTTRRSDTGHVLHIYILILGEVTQVMYYTHI